MSSPIARSLPEPFGRVIVEAMMAGTPVVATRGGGVDEIITDGQDGFLVPPADPAALALAVGRIMQDSESASKLASAALDSARERFCMEKTVGRMHQLLKDVVNVKMTDTLATRKIAIVHDWLPLYGGAERVLEQILIVFPQADVFSMIDAIPPEQRGFLQNKEVKTSFVQNLPGGKTRYRSYFPLMPLAVEQFDLSAYDLVISSSYSFAKGVLTGPDQRHLCYCHSPIRYAWDMQHQYLEQAGLTKGLKSWMVRILLHYIRLWDYRTAGGVDAFAANSAYIARRIMKVYRREAEVIFPPVAVQDFELEEKKEDFYLTASRMVPYKRIDLIAEAFSRMPEKRLIVIGDGPEMESVRAKAGPNVNLLGYKDNPTLRSHLQRAKAFVFAAEEDFRNSARGSAGLWDTGNRLRPRWRRGNRKPRRDRRVICRTVGGVSRRCSSPVRENELLAPEAIRRQAEKFSAEVFRKHFADFVRRNCEGWEASLGL